MKKNSGCGAERIYKDLDRLRRWKNLEVCAEIVY